MKAFWNKIVIRLEQEYAGVLYGFSLILLPHPKDRIYRHHETFPVYDRYGLNFTIFETERQSPLSGSNAFLLFFTQDVKGTSFNDKQKEYNRSASCGEGDVGTKTA